MDSKTNHLLKKRLGTKSVRDSSRKPEVTHDVIGTFTENLSYLNEVNPLASSQAKNPYADGQAPLPQPVVNHLVLENGERQSQQRQQQQQVMQLNGQDHHLAPPNIKNIAIWKQETRQQQQQKMLTDHKIKQNGVFGDMKQGRQVILHLEDMCTPNINDQHAPQNQINQNRTKINSNKNNSRQTKSRGSLQHNLDGKQIFIAGGTFSQPKQTMQLMQHKVQVPGGDQQPAVDVRQLAQIQLQDMEISQIHNESFQSLKNNQDPTAQALKMKSDTARGGSGNVPGAGGVEVVGIDDQRASRKKLRKLPKNHTQNQIQQHKQNSIQKNEQQVLSPKQNFKKSQTLKNIQTEFNGEEYDLDELPEQINVDYQHDPYQQISKIKYLNMMISHAISTSNELKYLKLMKKLKQVESLNEEDQLLWDNLEQLKDKSFQEVIQLCITKTTRHSLNQALSLSIETKRQNVAFDIVAFSMEMSFSLTITERQMQLLIKGQMFHLIQDLVNGHALLKIDASSLDADELLQVHRIQQKNDRDKAQNDSDKENQQSLPADGGGKKVSPDHQQQFEGGFAEITDVNHDRGGQGESGPEGVSKLRKRSYNHTPLINDLQRALEQTEKNNIVQPQNQQLSGTQQLQQQRSSSQKRFTKSGKRNRQDEGYDIKHKALEEVDPVSFNSIISGESKRNASQFSPSSDGAGAMQSPERQSSQRMSMNNEYLTRAQQFNNFHIQNQAQQHDEVSSLTRVINPQGVINLLPNRYNKNTQIRNMVEYDLVEDHVNAMDQQQQPLLQMQPQPQIQQPQQQQMNEAEYIAAQHAQNIQMKPRSDFPGVEQENQKVNQQTRPPINPINKQEQLITQQIKNALNETIHTNSGNSMPRNRSIIKENKANELILEEQATTNQIPQQQVTTIMQFQRTEMNISNQDINKLQLKIPGIEIQRPQLLQDLQASKVNLLDKNTSKLVANDTEQIQIMKNKLSLGFPKIGMPLPYIQEAITSRNDHETRPGDNLQKIISQQLQKNIIGIEQNQNGQTQGQSQAESMKIFTQLQESIKNLVKNNKFIVENNVEKTPQKAKTVQVDQQQQSVAQNRKQNFVEKYLKISDFLEYILENKEIFLEEQFKNVKKKEEEMQILNDFLKNFLMKTQDSIDFDKTVKNLIENELHQMLIDELFEQTDDAFKIGGRSQSIVIKSSVDKSKSARFSEIPPEQVNLFRKYARLKFLINLINQSVSMKQYQITYEVTKRFLSDLLKAPNLPIFDTLFNHLQEDTSRYEAKIALIFNCIPMMNRNVATRLMKVIEGVLQESSDNSILKNNINPLRVGLMFYRVIDEIQTTFAYSEHSSKLMKDMLCDQIVKVLDMYNDPEDLLVLVEETDYEGNDCFWYLDEYDLYSLMGCRIMDRVIQKKWNGKYEINATIQDYSTAFTLMRDRYTLFATDWVFQELRHEMLTIDRSDKTHGFKFHVWQESMLLRSRVDAGFSLFLTIYFQFQLNAFNNYYQEAMTLCSTLLNLATNPSQIEEFDHDIGNMKEHKYEQLQQSAVFLQYVMYASLINLLFPINTLMEWFFLRQTKRKPSDLDINFFNEMILCFASFVLYLIYFQQHGNRDNPDNLFLEPDMTDDQVFIANILWAKQIGTYPLEYMLAVLAGNCWVKLLLRLRVTQQFGPLFKVIQMMIIDLGIFLVLWIIILIMFSSASCMIFGQLPQFREFFDVLYMYLEYSLGTWDQRIYCEFNKIENAQGLCSVGKIYTSVFLLSNMVLLLNLVIAILSSTFGFYEDKKLGLYYEVLVGKFPSMEYDETFGAAVCAQPPFNLMILPFWWITLFPWTDSLKKYQYHYNLFLCHLLYLPLGLTFTAFFTLQNLFYVPVAYFKHSLVLIQTLTDSDETMDEFSEKVTRFFTIIKFIVIAPFILMIALPIDMFVFFKNLYSMPCTAHMLDNRDLITPKSIEILEQSCEEVLKERQEQTKEKGITHVNFVLLNKRLQKNLNVQKQIQNLIFDYNDDNKFITDPHSKTQKLNPNYLNRLREFNLLKRLVANCADKTCMVDTELLRSLIDQVELRIQMIRTQIHLGELEVAKGIEDMRQASLKELSRTEPKTVESKLNEDGQVLEVILDQVGQIQQDMGHLKSDVKKSHKLKYDISNIKSQIEINNQLLVGLMEQQKVGMMTLDSILQKVDSTKNKSPQAQQIPNIQIPQRKSQPTQQ